ncbi:MAG: flagellar hook-associated protein FlgK [Gammaproteobacteria bacterium]|nr:MAG: flagellar hook-associated protein FlgK [Gammaproteobacteria bacterium]
MASGLLGVGTSALLSYQRALDTVGHNVANVNTPGYSRQNVELSARQPQGMGDGFAGNGVDVSTVQRSYDQFITDELRSGTTAYEEQETLASLASGLDNLLADEHAGLSPVLGTFFDALQDTADDPASTAARQVLLSEAESLAARLHGLDNWMDDSRRGLSARMGAKVQELNQLSSSIAAVNQQIMEARSSSGGQPPNDLLDKRDQLVLELSAIVSVSTTTQDDGALNVFIGNGQALVLGVNQNTLELQNSIEDPGQYEIAISAGGSTAVEITDLINGGELGGLLTFRDQVLDPALNELGRIAIELGSFMNAQHQQGISLDGLPGQDLFSVASPQVIAAAGNGGSIAATFDDVTQLTADDYLLRFDGSNWNLTRADSGQVVPLSGTGTPADPLVAEGLSITIGPGAVAGDHYDVRPTREGARTINVLIADPRELALAAPVRTSAALTNTGSGSISAGAVTDINNPAFQSPPGQLSPSVQVRFTSSTAYEVIDQGTLAVLDTGTYDPATGADIFPTQNLGIDFGYQVRITGNPAASDTFDVGYNSGGTGDNRNALSMAGMQTDRLMNGGTSSLNDAYGELIADVGNKARQAQIGSEVQRQVLDQTQAEWSSAVGVNLDEEAANLVRFQQAYQAAARIISVADEIFQTLINAVGR